MKRIKSLFSIPLHRVKIKANMEHQSTIKQEENTQNKDPSTEILELKFQNFKLNENATKIQEERKSIIDEFDNIKSEWLMQKEVIENLLEAKQYYSAICQKQSEELTELKVKLKQSKKIQEELICLYHKTIKEKTLNELEIKGLIAKHHRELNNKEVNLIKQNVKVRKLYEQTLRLSDGSLEDNKSDYEKLEQLKCNVNNRDIILEGWLSIYKKKIVDNTKHDWNKQYVILSNENVNFYNSESDRNTEPLLVLDLCKILQVRPVAQSDVITADSKDIPQILQILYSSDGESKTDEQAVIRISDDKPGSLIHNGHAFLFILCHMPTMCEVCSKPMWHMFMPPPGFECQRCRIKIHKDHLDHEGNVAPCKVQYGTFAKELLLLAPSIEEQKSWVDMLRKMTQQCSDNINSSNNLDTGKVSPS